VEATSPLLWLARGYAVLDGPGFPIVAEGGADAEPNDTYVQQLTAAARAAVQARALPPRLGLSGGVCFCAGQGPGQPERRGGLLRAQELERRGVVDPARIAVGGHSCALAGMSHPAVTWSVFAHCRRTCVAMLAPHAQGPAR